MKTLIAILILIPYTLLAQKAESRYFAGATSVNGRAYNYLEFGYGHNNIQFSSVISPKAMGIYTGYTISGADVFRIGPNVGVIQIREENHFDYGFHVESYSFGNNIAIAATMTKKRSSLMLVYRIKSKYNRNNNDCRRVRYRKKKR